MAGRSSPLWMWGTADGAAVTWSIPAGSRDASAFKWLSLRLGQADGAPSEDLRILIRNGLVWSRELRLADYRMTTPAPTDQKLPRTSWKSEVLVCRSPRAAACWAPNTCTPKRSE